MLNNLRSHLDRKGITIRAYAEFLGVSEASVQNKIQGKTPLSYPEARKTKQYLFPEYEMEYLFATDDPQAS